ncbi:MAG: hypothetical protein F6J98_19865 [Moorea sp. SIO4G2]|nr:hypothetical protein [Moorena sp. SIO4G2]
MRLTWAKRPRYANGHALGKARRCANANELTMGRSLSADAFGAKSYLNVIGRLFPGSFWYLLAKSVSITIFPVNPN